MQAMTDKIKELRELLKQATPGPWKVVEDDEVVYGIAIRTETNTIAEWDDFPLCQDDAALIVAAVNSLGPLLDEIERLREFEWMYKELQR